jgi:hypothetical protein
MKLDCRSASCLFNDAFSAASSAVAGAVDGGVLLKPSVGASSDSRLGRSPHGEAKI